jgi:hypothetical protein
LPKLDARGERERVDLGEECGAGEVRGNGDFDPDTSLQPGYIVVGWVDIGYPE